MLYYNYKNRLVIERKKTLEWQKKMLLWVIKWKNINEPKAIKKGGL